jgi:hypothetical protein
MVKLDRWRLEIQLGLQALGPWWLAAIGCAALALGLWVAVLPGLRGQLRQQQVLVGQLQRQAPGRPVALDPRAPSVDALALFRATLAKGTGRGRFMRRLWDESAQRGLAITKVDYRDEPDLAGRFDRLEVTFPVTGTYPAVRNFALQLLADFPGLALDKFEIKREAPSQAEVTANLHFILLVEPS